MTGGWALPAQVEIRDVGPRDGLQAEQPLDVATRVALIRALAAAGLRRIEVGAFVSPRAVPAMAGTAEVIARLGVLDGVVRTALVPNARGARDALEAGVDELSVTVSASDEYGRRNTGMATAEALAELTTVCALAAEARTPVDVVISCAFGSPYEDAIPLEDVLGIAERARKAGADRVTWADTTGLATPSSVARLIDHAGPGDGFHLHETRGTALVNAFAALTLGAARFDCSIGGLGGSPFATGAAGNLATEDLVHVLDDAGVKTEIDFDALLAANELMKRAIGRALPSAAARAALRTP